MARVQLTIPDDDHDRFVRAARMEGMSLGAWLRAAAHARLRERRRRPSSAEELREFFRQCDARQGAEREPDWEEHKRAIEASRMQGMRDA